MSKDQWPKGAIYENYKEFVFPVFHINGRIRWF
jgi:hypothetical protein